MVRWVSPQKLDDVWIDIGGKNHEFSERKYGAFKYWIVGVFKMPKLFLYVFVVLSLFKPLEKIVLNVSRRNTYSFNINVGQFIGKTISLRPMESQVNGIRM